MIEPIQNESDLNIIVKIPTNNRPKHKTIFCGIVRRGISINFSFLQILGTAYSIFPRGAGRTAGLWLPPNRPGQNHLVLGTDALGILVARAGKGTKIVPQLRE